MYRRILLSAVTIASWLALTVPALPVSADETAVRVGVADSMATILRSPPKPSAEQAAEPIAWQKPIRVDLARNEFESAQLVVEAPADRQLNDVSVTITPLTRDTDPKDIWPSREISLWEVGQVETYNLWPPHQSLGWLPDPLRPLGKPFVVPAGHRYAILVRFHARPELVAGTYRGKVTVSAAGMPLARLPVEVTVWNFALPVQQHFTLSIPIWGGQMDKMYPGSQTPERRRAYLDMLYDHRVAPFPLGTDDIPHAIERGIRDFCLICFAKDSVEPDKAKQVGQQMDEWRKNGWDKQAHTYVLLGDEAPLNCFPHLREQGRLVREAAPTVARRFTVSPEITQDIAWIGQQMHGLADTLILGVAPGANDRLSKAVRATGLGLWWYYVALHYYIPTDKSEARVVFWRHWKYQVPGQLHWGMTYWGDANIAGHDGKKWPDIPWDTKACRSGDGYLVYPAPGGTAYWPSVRLEQLRDGVEDYEYFHWLKTLTGRLKPQTGDPAAARIAENDRLLGIDPSLVKSYTECATQPAAYRAYRQRIAQAIVATQHLLEEGNRQ